MAYIKPTLPRGTRDFAPEVMLRRDFIFDTIRNSFRKFGFQPLQTPAMENLDVLTGKYGEEGDRLIFRILNNGDYLKDVQSFDFGQPDAARSLTPLICEKALRYDLTVPLARFVVMNKHLLTFPFKRYQMQPVWRAENPQKGRYREFYQCDADVIGTDSLVNDAELPALYDDAFAALGFKYMKIVISNRKILSGIAEEVGAPEKLTDICIAIDKLDKIGEERVRAELGGRGLNETQAAKIFEIISTEGTNEEKLDFLETCFQNSESGRKGVAEMRETLKMIAMFKLKVADIEFDPKLARGLDYYTGTIYEVKSPDFPAGSLGGGGRYDDLTGIFGESGLAGVGISFGADRIFDAMSLLNLFPEGSTTATQVLLINFGEASLYRSLEVMGQLRDAGIASEIFPEAGKLKKQFKYADALKIPYAMVIGETELEQGTCNLKDMRTGEQKMVSIAEAISILAQ